MTDFIGWEDPQTEPASEPMPDEFGVAVDSAQPDEFNWRRLLRDANSVLLSAVVHLFLLIVAAIWTLSASLELALIQIESPTPSEEPVDLAADFEFEDLEIGEVKITSASAIQSPLLLPDVSANPQIDVATNIAELEPPTPTMFDDLLVRPDKLMSEIKVDDKRIIGKVGPSLREAGNEQEAVDGIAAEILDRRRKGDLLTLWLFDASISLRENRIKASKRLGVVFAEIDNRLEHSANQSKNGVVAFGNSCRTLVPPTVNNRRITRAIRDVPEDPSGNENVLQTVVWSIKQFRPKWQEKMMVVIWTDESGDDIHGLEQTIAFCKSEDVSVSVIGPTSVLGFEMGTHLFHHTPSRRNFYLPVNRGPETAIKQRVFMPRWRNIGWNKDEWLTEPINSGFAPYGLIRLTRETGGSYTIFDRVGDRGPFRLDAIRDYVPDYRSADEIEADLSSFPLRRALVSAVTKTYEQTERRPPRMTFFPIWYQPPEFQRRLHPVLVGEREYAMSMATLVSRALADLSSAEASYEQETSPRWRAAYDLARGRLMAMKIRYEEYAELCRTLKVRADTNSLMFRPNKRLRAQSGQDRAEEAERFLRRCIEEHPDTPWAHLANTELKHALGFGDVQRHQAAPNRTPRGRSTPISLPKL